MHLRTVPLYEHGRLARKQLTLCLGPANELCRKRLDPTHLKDTRPEPRQDIPTIRRGEVAPSVAQHSTARGPASAAQYLVAAGPGLGVALVRFQDEAGVPAEGVRAPLPGVPGHLPQPESTVTPAKTRRPRVPGDER